MTFLLIVYCWLWTYFTPCSSVSIVNFEHVNNADSKHTQTYDYWLSNQYHIVDFFRWASSLFSLVSPWNTTMVGTEMKILKICFSRLVETAFLESFFYTSCTLSLPSLLLYVCSHDGQFCPLCTHSQETENLVWSFWVGQEETSWILLAFTWFVFSRWKRSIKFWKQSRSCSKLVCHFFNSKFLEIYIFFK